MRTHAGAEVAQSLAAGGSLTVAITAATETDTAGNPGIRKGIGAAAETSLARVLGRARSIGRATETDAAQALTRRKTRTLVAAVETSLAQALRRVKTRLLGTATEASTAAAVDAVLPLGQALEVDVAGELTYTAPTPPTPTPTPATGGGWEVLVGILHEAAGPRPVEHLCPECDGPLTDLRGVATCEFDGWPHRALPTVPVSFHLEPERDRCPECGERLVEHRGELVCEFDGWPRRRPVTSGRRGAPTWSSTND